MQAGRHGLSRIGVDGREITRMGLPDNFVEHGTISQLREIVHLDVESIKKELLK